MSQYPTETKEITIRETDDGGFVLVINGEPSLRGADFKRAVKAFEAAALVALNLPNGDKEAA